MQNIELFMRNSGYLGQNIELMANILAIAKSNYLHIPIAFIFLCSALQSSRDFSCG